MNINIMIQARRRMSLIRVAFTTGMSFLILAILLLGLQPATPTLAGIDSTSTNTGIFVDSGQDVGGGSSNAMAIGDLDGDYDLDAFLRDEVWFNNGLGIFSDSGQELNIPGNVIELRLGDVDGDDDLDAVFAVLGSEPNQVWLNDGHGFFTNSGQTLGSAESWAVALGDVDDDDDLDAIFANSDAHRVWLNNGLGIFTDSNQNLGNSGFRAVDLEDLDGDDDLDAFFADCTIWLNNGSGVYTLKSQSLCPNDNVTQALGDMDGDDDIDAFIGNATKNPNLVWLNDGAANFSDSGQSLGNSSTEQIALGDVDGDGDLDAFVGNTNELGSNPADKVWTNNGTGVFVDSGQSLGAYNTSGAAFGDVDGDHDLDVLAGVEGGSPNRLLLNDGTTYLIYSPLILNNIGS